MEAKKVIRKIAIIILNYNGCQNTIDCINSIKNSTLTEEYKIVVVDNASTDDSKEKLSKLKKVIYIRNKENLGYSGGNDIGIIWALKNGYDQVLIINNDTRVEKNAIQILSDELTKMPIVTTKIYFEKGFEFHKNKYNNDHLGKIIWYAGGKIDWDNIIGEHIGVDEVDRGQYDNPAEIDFATGACLMVDRKVFDKIGLFDKKYFLYLEDMDFSKRAKDAGFKIGFIPKAIVWHKNAASTGGSGSGLQDYYITRNRLLFAIKFAKIRTKFAVLRQVISQVNVHTKRKALIDFLMYNFGKSDKFDS